MKNLFDIHCHILPEVDDGAKTMDMALKMLQMEYKDGVRPFFEATTDRIVTFHFMLHDQPGVLSSILGLMARSGANLLTVNQSIPMRGQASVTISARTGEMKYSVEELMHRAEQMEGVSKVEILASE